MAEGSAVLRLTDIIEAIERVRDVLGDMPLEDFEFDWQKQWLVERGVEIISDASRRLPDDLKARHGEIPWAKVAGIGNVLRHDYGSISAPIMWQLVKEHLPLSRPGMPRGIGAPAAARSGIASAAASGTGV
jgi:uncharacterized protein with HEPN domain